MTHKGPALTTEELQAQVQHLRARARRAEAALDRIYQRHEDSQWFVSGDGDLTVDCPYRDLMDNLDALVVFIDDEGFIRYANSYTASFLTMQRSELQGVHAREILDSIVPPGPEHYRIVDDLMANGDASRTDEIDLLGPDGTLSCVSWARRPVFGPDDELLGVVAVGTDVTARRDAQRQDEIYQRALRSLTFEVALAEERQRRSIATRIHEEISQNLAYAKLRVGALNGSVEKNGGDEAIEEINKLLDSAIAGTRALTFELSPPMLHELGFSEAIEWLAEQFEERHDIRCHFSDEREQRNLPAEVSFTLFRAVAELLNNIAEHSHADCASVVIDAHNGSVEVRVSDNGRGFNVESTLDQTGCTGGFGLFNIRERLRHLGGAMSIDSSPLTGTQVTLTAPATNGQG